MERVAPSALREYREHYQLLGPSCLCPLFQPVSDEPVFMEVAIYIPVFGRYAGEYVAECAQSQCGYLGQSLFMVKIEVRLDVPTPWSSAIREDTSEGWRSSEGISS